MTKETLLDGRSMRKGKGLRDLFPMYRSREEIQEEIASSPFLSDVFERWKQGQQEEFLDFCCGNRGVKVLYDTFFKKLFDPETGREDLISLLSMLLGREVESFEILSPASKLGGDSNLVVMDIVVQIKDGTIVNVEVQKIGYKFPGERAACYSADLLMRQYQRIRDDMTKEKRLSGGGSSGKVFDYRDVKPVYTIVLIEESTAAFRQYPSQPVHTFVPTSDTGLSLNLLQHYIFIPLDVFRKIILEKGIRSEKEAWIAFLSCDEPEIIYEILEKYPDRFRHLYEKICRICRDTEEVMSMFSKELAILDRNTVITMQEELQEEIKKQKEELDNLKKQKAELEKQAVELEKQTAELEKKNSDYEKQTAVFSERLAEKDSILARKEEENRDLRKKLDELERRMNSH